MLICCNLNSFVFPYTSFLQVIERKKLVNYLSNILKGVEKLEEFLKHRKKIYSVILVAHLNSVLPRVLFHIPSVLHSPLVLYIFLFSKQKFAFS